MHLEGAEPLAPDLSDLDDWYERGLRSLGPDLGAAERVRRRGAVPLSLGGPDTGPGLTPPGASLVQACNLRGILVDVSHLNEAGFWDVARAQPGAARRDATRTRTPSAPRRET